MTEQRRGLYSFVVPASLGKLQRRKGDPEARDFFFKRGPVNGKERRIAKTTNESSTAAFTVHVDASTSPPEPTRSSSNERSTKVLTGYIAELEKERFMLLERIRSLETERDDAIALCNKLRQRYDDPSNVYRGSTGGSRGRLPQDPKSLYEPLGKPEIAEHTRVYEHVLSPRPQEGDRPWDVHGAIRHLEEELRLVNGKMDVLEAVTTSAILSPPRPSASYPTCSSFPVSLTLPIANEDTSALKNSNGWPLKRVDAESSTSRRNWFFS